MKKLLEKVLSFNTVLFIFCALGVRATIMGSDLGTSLSFMAVAAVVGLERYIAFKRGPDINAELQKQLQDIKSYVTALSFKQGLKKETIEPPKEGQRWF